jgi:hypothetical protein
MTLQVEVSGSCGYLSIPSGRTLPIERSNQATTSFELLTNHWRNLCY